MKNNIRVLRAIVNISQKELANMSGLSRATINIIENEKCIPKNETKIKIANAFKKSKNEIFFD